MKSRTFFLFGLILLLAAPAWAGHGLSLDGQLKYPAGFAGFDYTSKEAKVGGTLTLHSIGGFDKMNPFTLKGTAPDLLNTLLFESLTTRSLDEAFSQYALLASDIAVAADGQSITYTLDSDATFSDGTPVTPEDVKFSLETLKSDKAHPAYQAYWRDILSAEVLDASRVRLHFASKNRELAMISGEFPIFSKAFFTQHAFDKGDLTVPLASGPYRVASFNPGKTIIYERNPDYWGWQRGVNRGMYNFERIVIKYFRDPVVAQEGFKAGEFDFIFENNSKQWARDYKGDKFTSGKIIKETLDHSNGVGMQGFVFNLRRPIFQDIRVRQALSLAFDFEWSNRNLFYSQYARSDSYFTNTEMAARGKPSAEELKLLEPFRKDLDPAVFEAVTPPPSTEPPASLRKNLRQAMKLLKSAGWKVGPDKVLVNGQGQRFEVETVLVSPAFERILAPYTANLKKLGVVMTYRTVDPSLYQRRVNDFDYDMIVAVFGQSQSPGNEQRNMWHSQSADVKGSQNRIGLKDPIIDALVDHIIYAKDRKALVTACRALDRVLLSGHYVVPHWYIPYHRIAYWDQFARPETKPSHFTPTDWLLAWWIEK
ncbi:MAG: ABC transporter substrate-binding protein [Magnetococcales bacterium]|nr:ABC transporter substrate-binding protein [Magnetococcales bacterium]